MAKNNKGFYNMEAKINNILSTIETDIIFNDTYVMGKIENIIKKRMAERGELSGKSFKNLCIYEAELIIKKHQYSRLSYGIFKDTVKERINTLEENIIPKCQLYSIEEFKEKSNNMDLSLKSLKQYELNKIQQHNKFIDDTNKEFKQVLIMIFISILLIPIIIYFFK